MGIEFARRRLAPDELDYELIWLAASLGGLACAAAWLHFDFPWPRCLFHQLTALPCVTCGMTRAAIAFFHADFATAFNWNPLIFIALCALSIFDGYAVAVLAMRAPRLRVRLSKLAAVRVRIFAVTVLALNWTYLIGHRHSF